MRLALRWGLAAVFLASAMLKLVDFEPTWVEIGRSLSLTDGMAQALVSALVLGEMALAGALLFATGGERRVLALTAAVMTLFLAASAWMAVLGVENCGCFGTRFAMGPGATAAKNAVMLATALFLFRSSRAPTSPVREMAASA